MQHCLWLQQATKPQPALHHTSVALQVQGSEVSVAARPAAVPAAVVRRQWLHPEPLASAELALMLLAYMVSVIVVFEWQGGGDMMPW